MQAETQSAQRVGRKPVFKWPEPPSPAAGEHEVADFLELVAWRDSGMSVVELKQLLGLLDEADYADGVPEENAIDGSVEHVFAEVERRRDACSGAYPFVIDNGGQSLRFDVEDGNDSHAIYLFLLLATRLDMAKDRQQGEVDGTKVFEELGAQSARCYLGPRAESMVFGTAAGGDGFAAKVDDLCRRLGEGDGFDDRFGGGEKTKDDKLDVVAWTPFADGQRSKIILFGQCKTGTHYKDQLTELQPDVFCDNWWCSPPAFTPTRTFFVAEALSRVDWGRTASKAGLLFDRCRIVDVSDTVSPGVLEGIRTWTRAAAVAANLPSLP